MNPAAFDLRTTVRALRRNRWFSSVAITTLCLGLTANIVLFSILEAVRSPELPYEAPSRLFVVREAYPPNGWRDVPPSLATMMDVRRDAGSFSEVAAYSQRRVSLGGSAQASTRVAAAVITANLWTTLGVPPALGGSFAAGDDKPGTPGTVMISDRLWRSRYGSDPAILDRTMLVDGVSRRILGVMPAGFHFPEAEDLWLPLAVTLEADPRAADAREARAWGIIARLRDDAGEAQARAELNAIANRSAQAHPETHRGWLLTAVGATDEVFAAVGPFFTALQAGAILLLLIMCGNLANLLLARGEQRVREMAIRIGLGASRADVVRLLLAEALLLSALGAVAAVILASWIVSLLPAAIPEAIPFFIRFRIDGNVLAFTAALATVSALAAGAGSALRTPHRNPLEVLAGGASSLVGKPRSGRLRSALLCVQTTIAAALLASALVVAHGQLRFDRVDLGYDPANTVLVDVPLPPRPYADADATRLFVGNLLERLAAMPAVEAASAAGSLPMASPADGSVRIETDAHTGRAASGFEPTAYQSVTPDFFRAARIDVLSGRSFTVADTRGAAPVAIVNAEAARRFFGGSDPLGRRIRFGRSVVERTSRVVVGVVENTIVQPLDPEIEPRIYVPFDQDPGRILALTIRTRSDPVHAAGAIAGEIRRIDPAVAAEAPIAGEERLRTALWPVRFFNGFATVFAGVGLLVAAAGVYGLTQYLALGRVREMALRMALGAAPGHVRRLLVVDSAWPVALGVLLGLTASLAVSNVLQHVIPGVPSIDPLALSVAAAVLFVAGLGAVALPAMRAARVSPAEALRRE